MSYYFPVKQALAKRKETVEGINLPNLESKKLLVTQFDKLAKEDIAKGDEEKATMWFGYWKQWARLL